MNSFTGPITLVRGTGPPTGYLTIGGTLTRNNGNTIGTGTLGSGNYAGNITTDTATIVNYASTATQTLSGIISGPGALQVTGSGALTLSGVNTYTGNTTVSSGCSMTLANGGGLKFVITDSTTTNNKVTGAGSATLNGIFTVDTSAVTVTSGTWTLVDTTTKILRRHFRPDRFHRPRRQHLHQERRRPDMDLQQVHRRAVAFVQRRHHCVRHPRLHRRDQPDQ